MEGFIGQITLFAGTFAPQNWAFCEGQVLSVAQNPALFSILGANYGGDGQTNFALPDLRGRAPLQQGQGPGLPRVRLGQAEDVAKPTDAGNPPQFGTLGLNYIICINGIFPPRS